MNQDKNAYVAFYKSKKVVIYADTLFEAKEQAEKDMKVPHHKRHEITVVLAEKAGIKVETFID